jgi:SnoaL-like domain
MTDPLGASSSRAATSAEMERLLAHAEINDVLVAYCQGVDRRDWDQVLACYHDDARDSHSQFEGSPAGVVRWMRENHQHVSSCMHVLTNVSISISKENDRFARAESYCLSHKAVSSAEHDPYFRAAGGGGPLRRTVACRYIDTFENRVGVGWRILARNVVIEWMRRDPGDLYLPLDPAMASSRRDRDDLLYSPLATPRAARSA